MLKKSICMSTATFFFGITTLAATLITSKEVELLRTYESTAFENGYVYSKPEALSAWVQDRNSETRKFLDSFPIANEIRIRNGELLATPAPVAFNTPSGDFYLRQGSLYFQSSGGAPEKILVDKSTLNGHALTDFKVSPDGQKVLFATSLGGSDSQYWSAIDVTTLKLLTSAPLRVRIYAPNWNLASTGFYYAKWPDLKDEFKMVANQTVRTSGVDMAFHRLGDLPTNDVTVLSNNRISTVYAIDEIPGSVNIVAHRIKLGFAHQLSILFGVRQSDGQYEWHDIIQSNQYIGRLVTTTPTSIIALSSEPGENFGLVSYSVNDPTQRKTLVGASSDVLAQAQRVGSNIVAQYFTSEFKNYLRIFDLDGNEVDRVTFEKYNLPGRGSLPAVLSGGPQSKKVSFTYSSIELPSVTLLYDLNSRTLTPLPSLKSPVFSGNLIDSRVETFKSFDGTEIPIQIYNRKDIQTPKFYYLYYYGSNGVLNSSGYNLKFQHMLELGGAVALVGVRGGGERGASWYKSGMNDRMTSIQDVAFASRWIKSFHSGIKMPVVAAGRSYGGMLTNAVMTQFSDDFDIFVPIVSIADLEYFMTDYFGAIGWDDLGFNRDQDGQIIDSPMARQILRNWSPALHVDKMKTLGGVILFTAERDERTGPHQTYLMTELLRRKFPNSPVYMFESNGGHMARSEHIDEATFVAALLGIKALQTLK